MKQTQIHKICKAIAGLGPLGHLKASGTWGSVAALPFVCFLAGYMWLVLLTLIAFVVGVLVIRPLIQGQQDKDPSFVIIDEWVGQLAVFCFFPKGCLSPILLIFGFLFFRLFDILKPWPASFFDRKVHSGLGVMLDDLMAAIYAMIALAFMIKIGYNI